MEVNGHPKTQISDARTRGIPHHFTFAKSAPVISPPRSLKKFKEMKTGSLAVA
jgi:hypothetical protein